MVVYFAGSEVSPFTFLQIILAGIPTTRETAIEIMEYDQIVTSSAGTKYFIPTMTADAAINASVAPNVFATFVNAPRINVPIRIPSTSPINPLNHSYADFTPPFASTIDTTIAKIPTIRDTY